MTKKEREKYRITIPDCIKRIEEQTNGDITSEGWFPVPSCSPLTSFIEAFTKKEQYELSIHFACGAGHVRVRGRRDQEARAADQLRRHPGARGVPRGEDRRDILGHEPLRGGREGPHARSTRSSTRRSSPRGCRSPR